MQVGLANALLQLGKYPQALKEFQKATELDGKSSDAWYGLGATYLSLEKQIENQLRQANSPYRGLLLGESYLEQGQAEKAIATLETAVHAGPDLKCSHAILGFAYLRAGKREEAATQFSLDWKEDSRRGCLLGKLGNAVLTVESGDRDRASKVLQDINAIDHDFISANSDWARNQLPGPQVEVPNSLSETVPGPSEELAGEGRYSACSKSLAQQAGPKSMKDLKLESFCSFYSGRNDQVLRATSDLLERSIADPEALYWRIKALERAGLVSLDHGIELNPDSPSLHSLMGDMLRGKGDNAEAAVEYGKALSENPDFIAAQLGLARSLYSDRRGADAEQQVRAVLEASPDDPGANYLEGEILVDRRAYPQALPFLLKALKVSPDEEPYVHADLSSVYEDAGDLRKAISEMKEAVVVDIDGGYYYRLGHLYARAGNKAEASEALQESARRRHAVDAASQFQKAP